MQTRQLGRSGIVVPRLIFGGNVFGWTVDETASFKLLDALVEAGVNAVDTADVYSAWAPGNQGGESETVIGNWLKRRGGRDNVIVITKVGLLAGSTGLARGTIAQAVENSLRRLQTDYIDAYLAHRDDENTPLDETLEAFARLVEAGKVRAVGASNYTAPRLREALETSRRLGLPRYELLQPHYNLVERAGYEAELEKLCEAEQVGVISYFSLASGFLTGKYHSQADLDQSPRGARYVVKYIEERPLRVLAAVEDAAKRLGASPAEVAIAWLMARPSVTAPIASATSLAQLRTLLGAARLTLDRDTVESLDRASA